jgi:ElaB/YqjD/DUF883 family membrane-anchored ribosome-binding protein
MNTGGGSMRVLITLAAALAGPAGCQKQSDPPRNDVEREARELAQAAKHTAGALAEEAKEVTAKAGDEMAAGARKLGDKAGPLLEELGDKIQRAGQSLDQGTADERKSFARETRETLEEVKGWVKQDARPKAERGASKLKDDVGELADDVERKLDKMQKQAGPAARRTQEEIREGLEKIRDKLREAP